jgi:hypothetical protein
MLKGRVTCWQRVGHTIRGSQRCLQKMSRLEHEEQRNKRNLYLGSCLERSSGAKDLRQRSGKSNKAIEGGDDENDGRLGYAPTHVAAATCHHVIGEQSSHVAGKMLWGGRLGVIALSESDTKPGLWTTQAGPRSPQSRLSRPGPAQAFTARLPGLDGFGPGPAHH